MKNKIKLLSHPLIFIVFVWVFVSACASHGFDTISGSYKQKDSFLELRPDSSYTFDYVSKETMMPEEPPHPIAIMKINTSGRWQLRRDTLVLHILNFNGISKSDERANSLALPGWEEYYIVKENRLYFFSAFKKVSANNYLEKVRK